MSGLLPELKRRKVVRAAVLYVAAAFAALQAADLVFPLLRVPDWGLSLVLGLAVVGFPVVIAVAWAFEVTPEGLRRTEARALPSAETTGWLTPATVGLALLLALGGGGTGWFLGWGGRSGAAADQQVNAPQLDSRAVAALPFENRSGLEENLYFTDGIHDEILTHLHNIGDLRVISRTSVEEYRDRSQNLVQVARELGVGSILEGGVQRTADRVRINAQLIDVSTGRENHLWAHTYTRDLSASDLFEVQGEIAREVARALAAALSPEDEESLARRPTASTEAYDAYLHGLTYFHRWELRPGNPGWDEAAGHFRRAVEADPEFAEAWARLGEALVRSIPFLDGAEAEHTRRREGEEAIAEALRLDPNLAGAHLARAVLLSERDDGAAGLEAGLEAARRALDAAPDRADVLRQVAVLNTSLGRVDEAATFWERAARVDPRSAQTATLGARNDLYRGRLVEARAGMQRALELTDSVSGTSNILVPLVPLVHALDGLDAALALVEPRLAEFPPGYLQYLAMVHPDLLRSPVIADRVLSDTTANEAPEVRPYLRGWHARIEGRDAEARSHFADALRIEDDRREDSGVDRRIGRAYMLAVAGNDAEAREVIAGLESEGWREEAGPLLYGERLALLVAARAWIGDIRLAVQLLREGLDRPNGMINAPYLESHIRWDPLREDPGFRALLREYR